MALSFRMFLAFESTLARASSRCSVETNSSFIASASRWAASSTRFNSRLSCGGAAGDVGEMAQFGLDDLVQLPPVDADPIEDRPDDAVGLGQQGRQQVQRVDLCVAAVGRQLLGPRTASWAFNVSLSKRNAMIVWSPLPLGEG